MTESRYEVQTQAGQTWTYYCETRTLDLARAACNEAKATGYRARIYDHKTNKEVK